MKVKKHSRKHSHISLFSLLIMALMLISIGYASINSVILEISAKVDASVPKTIFITDVQYVSDVDANITNSQIHDFTNTTMQSTVQLSSTNPNSEIVYKVTVYNNSGEEAVLKNAIYIEDYYDNEGITYEILETGFKQGDTIKTKETKDIYIKFKYKDSTVASNTTLNSYIKFSIGKPNMLKLASGNGDFLGAVSRDSIEKISFELGKTPENATQTFDASANQDNSIIGYVTDTDGNGKNEITFSSDDIIFANTDSSYLFFQLTSLTTIEFNNFNTSKVTSMYCMFSWCSKLTSLDLSGFDTSNVVRMSSMFKGCRNLTSLDLSGFDTSKVTGMSTMFYSCSSLTSLDLSKFDTSNVTNMSSMFWSCSGLTSLDVSGLDTSKVTDMSTMFQECRSLTSLDVSGFDTSNVTYMAYMFQECRSLTSLDVSGFDTSKVTNMAYMFNYCSGLTSLDVSKFDTSNVTNMAYMFNYCSGLTSLDVSKFDTSNVTNMSYMFNYCSGLTSLDVSNFDTSNVTNMNSMFNYCKRLTTIYASNTFNTDKVTYSSDMFNACTNLIGGSGTTFDSNVVDKTYARIDTASAPGYFTKGKEKRFLKVCPQTSFWEVVSKEDVTNINFEDNIENAPSKAIDISELEDGSILCWVASGSELYIASNENIYANPNSSNLFLNLRRRRSL